MKKILWSLSALVASVGLLSCAADKSEPLVVHPALQLGLWTTSHIPVPHHEQWSAYGQDQKVLKMLYSIQSRGGEFLPYEEDSDSDIEDVLSDLLGDLGGGSSGSSASSSGSSSGAGSGGALPSSPSVGSGVLPTGPSFAEATLPVSPFLGSTSLHATPAFMTSYGSGSSGGSAFVDVICDFVVAIVGYAATCEEVDLGASSSQIKTACRAFAGEAVREELGDVSVPLAVVNGLRCITRQIERLPVSSCPDNDNDLETLLLEAYSSCGLLVE